MQLKVSLLKLEKQDAAYKAFTWVDLITCHRWEELTINERQMNNVGTNTRFLDEEVPWKPRNFQR